MGLLTSEASLNS